jgi:hypothetical protein
MQDKTYNGWTNYATWRVNLEVFDGLEPTDLFDGARDVYDLSKQLEAFAEEVVLGEAEGLAADYAAAFLSEVDFYSIAEHMAEDYDLFTEEEDA